MTSLAELQRDFQARILKGRRGIETQLVQPADHDLDARLGTYVGGYRARLVEALGANYSALCATLGAEEFERRMSDYIEAHPSQHYSVRYYGAGLAGWIGCEDAGAAGTTLAELARWEWLLAEVFDAPDDEPLTEDALAGVPPDAWGGVSFRFRTSMRRIETCSHAVDHWRAANDLVAASVARAVAAPVSWVLWRRGVSTFFRSLDPVERLVFDSAVAGETFGALCERLLACVDETQVAMRAASLLRGWLAEELLAGLRLPGEVP